MPEGRSNWAWIYLPAALLLPFALEAFFIIITREFLNVPDWADVFVLGALAAIGAYCVWWLPLEKSARVMLVCLYIPSIVFLLVGFGLAFVGFRGSSGKIVADLRG